MIQAPTSTSLFVASLAVCSLISAPQHGEEAQDRAQKSPPFLLKEASAAKQPSDVPKAQPAAEPRALSADETGKVLERLPALPLPATRRDASPSSIERPRPPPREADTAKTVELPLESPASPSGNPPPAKAGPLRVVRRSPEGEVPHAARLSITFSEPMVPVGTLSDLDSREVPVRLRPRIDGTWQWLGTKTLIFEPRGRALERRFPLAAEFHVEIPAGTTSLAGHRLEETVSWRFETPPPKVVLIHPQRDPQSPDEKLPLAPLFFVAFNQKIDPLQVLPQIEVRCAGDRVALRPATREEVQKDRTLRRERYREEGRSYFRSARAIGGTDRWVAFVPESRLPPSSEVTVRVQAGVRSSEGTRTMAQAKEVRLETVDPLRVTGHGCLGDRDGPCSADGGFIVRFNNPIDGDAFDPGMVQVTPVVPRSRIQPGYRAIRVHGPLEVGATYRVSLDASIRDVFGMKLGEPRAFTFEVGLPHRELWALGGPFVSIDATSARYYPVYSTGYDGLRVAIYAVAPGDWSAFHAYREYYPEADDELAPAPPGRLLSSDVVPVDPGGVLVETRIDLARFRQQSRQFVLVITPQGLEEKDTYTYRQILWVQMASMGLVAFSDRTELTVWVSSLRDARPLEGVELSLLPEGPRVRSGTDGLARLPLETDDPKKHLVLVARRGDDVALLPRREYASDYRAGWVRRKAEDKLIWFAFDERGLYRPGDTVHVKGWLRRIDRREGGDVELPADGIERIRFEAHSASGVEIASGEVPLNDTAGFDFTFRLPESVELGHAAIVLAPVVAGDPPDDWRDFRYIRVEEFRRPESEFFIAHDPGPHIAGGKAEVSVEARYFTGAALSHATVWWTVRSLPASLSVPGWEEYTFGTWSAWWETDEDFHRSAGVHTVYRSGQTDADGRHRLEVELRAIDPPRPLTLTAEAQVSDINRQDLGTATTRFVVYPAERLVGLRPERPFVAEGESLDLRFVVTDLDGRPKAGHPVRFEVAELYWEEVGDKRVRREKPARVFEAVSRSAAEVLSVAMPQGGTFRLRGVTRDDAGRRSESEVTVWVAGAEIQPAWNTEKPVVNVIPDRERYRPGDTARVLVQSPFRKAAGILTVLRSGVIHAETFSMEGASRAFEIPILEEHIPHIYVHVSLQAPGSSPRAMAHGGVPLRVPPDSRRLDVEVAPERDLLRPGERTEIAVSVRDAEGRPVQDAEVALVVADEAVLSLADHDLDDPLGVFYDTRGSDTALHLVKYSPVVLDREELLWRIEEERYRNAPDLALDSPEDEPSHEEVPFETANLSGDPPADTDGTAGEKLEQRADFRALALFAPSLRTDAKGQARVPVMLPHNLTRYRITAVATADVRFFGTATSSITARLPLMVRPSPPRFLNHGDRFELPVVVQNRSDAPVTVDLAVRSDRIAWLEGQGREVEIPPRQRLEERFPAEARDLGVARVQVAAVSADWSDAAQLVLPIKNPLVTEAFAVYGELEGGAVRQPLAPPAGVLPELGGLELTVSSTVLSSLADAVLYLVDYPYECGEQLASRILAIAALRDALEAFGASGLPSEARLVAQVEKDVARLCALQADTGGFGFWSSNERPHPYVSSHATHALVMAREARFRVPEDSLVKAAEYLRNIEKRLSKETSTVDRVALEAYALSVLARLTRGEEPGLAAKARSLASAPDLPVEAIGWLLPILARADGSSAEVAELRRRLSNRVVETAGLAHFASSYRDSAELLLHSDRRTDAVLLAGLLEAEPENPLVVKLARGLLAHRAGGRWLNTQENVFALLALERYFRRIEGRTPECVFRAWLGDRQIAEEAFAGRSADRRSLRVPMDKLASLPEVTPLTLAKEGPGRLYFRLGLEYVPASRRLDPVDRGFAIERRYAPLSSTDQVRRGADGSWRIRRGAGVFVVVRVFTRSVRHHVALVDPLPAGLEVPNDRQDEWNGRYRFIDRPRSWQRFWFEHENLRDDRAEAFARRLEPGVHTYAYVVRATTPGTFLAAPAKVEEMYQPETFGRGATDTVVIE